MARLAIADFSFSTWWRGDAMGTRRRVHSPEKTIALTFRAKPTENPFPLPNLTMSEHRSNGMTNAAKK
jgi:hypothetical protein